MEIGLQVQVPADFIPLKLSKVTTLGVPQSQYEHSGRKNMAAYSVIRHLQSHEVFVRSKYNV
jgi:hypothetical protein